MVCFNLFKKLVLKNLCFWALSFLLSLCQCLWLDIYTDTSHLLCSELGTNLYNRFISSQWFLGFGTTQHFHKSVIFCIFAALLWVSFPQYYIDGVTEFALNKPAIEKNQCYLWTAYGIAGCDNAFMLNMIYFCRSFCSLLKYFI